MPGNKVIMLGIGRIGRTFPIITEHLHLCDKKLHLVTVPEKNNVTPALIEQRAFDVPLDLRVFSFRDVKALVNIYKSVQRKYYPEKDVYIRGK